jgi:predicted nucleotide-binding protein
MRLFLSFAIEDLDFTRTVADALETAGHSVIIDMGGIPGGNNWRTEVGRAIHHSDWFVVIYSVSHKDSLKRKLEFIFALSNEIPILYVLTEPTEMIGDEVSRVIDISLNPLHNIGKITEFFLNPPSIRRGMNSWEAAEQAARETQEMMSVHLPERVFIAYSRKQRTLAKDLHDLLVANGKAVFWDAKLRAGAVWRQMIQKALDDSTHVVVLWTPDAAESDEVEREVSYALAERKRVIPILNGEIPKLPYHLHGLHYVVLEADVKALEKDLIAAIEGFSGGEDLYS